MQSRPTTREERARHVTTMNANFALEDMHPQADDLDLQRRYVAGEISLDDMLDHTRDFARRHGQPASL